MGLDTHLVGLFVEHLDDGVEVDEGEAVGQGGRLWLSGSGRGFRRRHGGKL